MSICNMVGVQVRMLETYYDAAEEGDPEDDGTRGVLASAELMQALMCVCVCGVIVQANRGWPVPSRR